MSKEPKHRVSRVVFAMLRTTRQYENDRAECVVDVAAGASQEDIDAAYADLEFTRDVLGGIRRAAACGPRASAGAARQRRADGSRAQAVRGLAASHDGGIIP